MSCNNPNQPFNIRIIVPEKEKDEEVGSDIEIRGVSPIKVKKQMEGTKTVFIISYSPSVGPSVSISANPNRVEIGVPTNVTFTVTSSKGSSPIVSTVITPKDLDANNSKLFTFMVGGAQGNHSVTVTDEEGQTATASASVQVVYRFFKGTIERNNTVLDASTIQAFASNLGSSIGEAFGRQQYEMDKTQGHFLWLYPADFNSIPTPTGDGNFPFQLTPVDGTWTINGIAYKAAKTSTYFNAGAKATLGF